MDFPNAYPAHQNSSWSITVARGFLVKLQITDLAIAGETGQCKEDKLIVSDKYSVLGQLLLLILFTNLVVFLRCRATVYNIIHITGTKFDS